MTVIKQHLSVVGSSLRLLEINRVFLSPMMTGPLLLTLTDVFVVSQVPHSRASILSTTISNAGAWCVRGGHASCLHVKFDIDFAKPEIVQVFPTKYLLMYWTPVHS